MSEVAETKCCKLKKSAVNLISKDMCKLIVKSIQKLL